MSQERYSHFIAIVGAPGRGKTSLVLEAVKKAITNGDRALIIIPDRNEKAWYDYYNQLISADEMETFNPNFTGVCVMEYRKGVTFPFLLNLLQQGILKNLNIVLDDPFYARKNPEPDLITILSRQRQYQIDTWTNTHGIDQLPPDFFQYITIFGIMYTNGEIRNRASEVPELIAVKQRVDNIAGTKKENNTNFHYVEFVNKLGEKL